MTVPNWCWFLFYFYRKISLPPSTLKLLFNSWHCLVRHNAGTLHNCSLAWLNDRSHINGWMISTTRQHFEGILVLFTIVAVPGGSDEGDGTLHSLYILPMSCWTTSLCFHGRRNQKGIIVMKLTFCNKLPHMSPVCITGRLSISFTAV